MLRNNLLEEICTQFGLQENAQISVVPKSRLLSWMQSQDLEVLGAIYAIIMNKTYAIRIQPLLTFEDYQPFVMIYLKRCLLEDRKGKWAYSRYEAGWALTKWFSDLWNDPAVPRTALNELKIWLSILYKLADEKLKSCLINAVFEHLFERSEISVFFRDWQEDPELVSAYKEALAWSEK